MLQERTIPQSLEKGERYFMNDRVLEPFRRGTSLEARVQGSRPSPYRVDVTLTEEGRVQKASCTCPYSYGGDCKHIVAVILLWNEDPEAFSEASSVSSDLEARSKDELVKIIEMMIDREPSLQSILDQDIPGNSDKRFQLEDPEHYRQEVLNCLSPDFQTGRIPEFRPPLNFLIDRARRHFRQKEHGCVYGICTGAHSWDTPGV